MQVLSSLKSAKKRHPDCQIVKRRGRLFVICKSNPRFKAVQGKGGKKKQLNLLLRIIKRRIQRLLFCQLYTDDISVKGIVHRQENLPIVLFNQCVTCRAFHQGITRFQVPYLDLVTQNQCPVLPAKQQSLRDPMDLGHKFQHIYLWPSRFESPFQVTF